MINCNNCNTENEDNSKFCINCGEQLVVETGRRGPRPAKRRHSTEVGGYVSDKTPAVSCVLSLIVVGAGQFYNGDTKKGAYLLGGAIALSLVSVGIAWFALAVYSAYDAYQVADGKKELGEW